LLIKVPHQIDGDFADGDNRGFLGVLWFALRAFRFGERLKELGYLRLEPGDFRTAATLQLPQQCEARTVAILHFRRIDLDARGLARGTKRLRPSPRHAFGVKAPGKFQPRAP